MRARALVLATNAYTGEFAEAGSKALAQATEGFAAQRMNRGIAQALSGKNIATI